MYEQAAQTPPADGEQPADGQPAGEADGNKVEDADYTIQPAIKQPSIRSTPKPKIISIKKK